MKKTICDRCGNEINESCPYNTYVLDPEAIYTTYDITATTHSTFKHPLPTQRVIDLCPSCEKEFSDWLHNFEEMANATKED